MICMFMKGFVCLAWANCDRIGKNQNNMTKRVVKVAVMGLSPQESESAKTPVPHYQLRVLQRSHAVPCHPVANISPPNDL